MFLVLVFLVSSDGQGSVRLESCLLMVCLFVAWMRHPARGAAGSWVMPGLVYKWSPLWEFSLIDTP